MGSRARGDHQPDSDYDVLVVLNGPIDRWPELHRLSKLSTKLTWDTVTEPNPAVVSLKAVTEDDIAARTGFMHNVRREMTEL
jgi:predicted nucleotidyltransferase